MKQRQIAVLCSIAIGISAGSGILNHYCTGGYKIVVEGKTIGYVEDSIQYENALSEVNETLARDFGTEYTLNPDAKIQSSIFDKESLSSPEELHNNIAKLSGYMTEGYILTLNGEELCTFKSEEDARKALALVCDEYTVDGGTSHIYEEYTLNQMQVSSASIASPEDGAKFIIDNNLLSVKTTASRVYYVTTDFETIEQPDDSLLKGNRQILREGEVGETAVSAVMEYINGELTEEKIISEAVVSEPVTQVVKVGTKVVPDMGTGKFIVPSSGRLSSPFGPRWGRMHNGVDLAAPTGTPIYASDSGVVTFAGYKSSYGNLVKIDHKNGYVTVYAHCNDIYVNEGESVVQGQKIASTGSTGNSTGPHLHFEIQLDGVPQNPQNYIKL